MDCRPGCGACCIAPSITTPIPSRCGGQAQPKRAGDPCEQLSPEFGCRLFGQARRPMVCRTLQPQAEMCGTDRTHALAWLARLERATAPEPA